MKKQPAAFLLVLMLCASFFSACSLVKNEQKIQDSQARVLVFSRTNGFYHKSIPDGISALQRLGKENNFKVDTTKNPAYFRADSLQNYAAVIFLSTTGNVLNPEQETAFKEYISKGGGFVGIHSATHTEMEWEWFNQLVGAQFVNHPEIQDAAVLVVDKNHPSTYFLPERWQRRDEWYNYKNIYPGIKVLATLDESSYSGGTNGKPHPIAWYHEVGSGRSFYTGGGHSSESFLEPLFLQHLKGGILYAMGRESVK